MPNLTALLKSFKKQSFWERIQSLQVPLLLQDVLYVLK